ncbi:hypothetical protein vseg_019092 [Gypsophila vaccaria]
MANQSQPRPWFRLASLARPVQPGGPPPAPAPAPAPPPASTPRPQMQPPAGLLPRPTMMRPPLRPPVAPQPQAGQNAPPPTQTLRPPPPSSQQPPVTSAPSVPSAVVAPMSPSKLPSRITTSPVPQKSPLPSPVTQKSPTKASVTQKSPPESPVTQKSRPESPITQKSPPYASTVTRKSPLNESLATRKSPLTSPVTQNAPVSPLTEKSPLRPPVTQKSATPRASSPVSSTIPSPYPLPSSSVPRTQSLPPSILFSTAIKQEVARSMLASPPMPDTPSTKQVSSPAVPTPPKTSNGFLSAVSIPPVVARTPTPELSSRADKPLPETPPQSPKIKATLRSPPLFSLPPSQLESDDEYERKIPAVAEQKTVRHVQETLGKPRSVLGSHPDNLEKPPVRMGGNPKEGEIKKGSNSEDIGMRVITISGENRGAVMELGHSRGTHGSHHKLGNEASSKTKDGGNTSKAKPSTPTHAFMNSNVQGVNSSIVFNSTISHHDPGVHLSLSRKPGKGGHMEYENEVKISQKEGVEF